MILRTLNEKRNFKLEVLALRLSEPAGFITQLRLSIPPMRRGC